MLTHIYIKNFAIIKEIDIDLNERLNIISGETGTGKSIVIQAINMALGGRGSTSFVAEGEDKALVQLVFSLDDGQLTALPEYERFIDGGENTLIISREFNRNGKSMARINGEIVTLSVLSGLTSHLVDIHGQYDNQTFLDPNMHMSILDSCGGSDLYSLKEDLSSIYAEYQSVRSELLKIRSGHAEFLRKQDFLRFEMNEIDAADVRSGEDEELSSQLKMLQNSEKIYSSLSESYEILSSSRLERCRILLEDISEFSEEYSSISATVNESVYALDDICEEIRRARDSFSFTPDEIDTVISRLDILDTLKKKYGGSLEKVLEYRNKCRTELEKFENTEEQEKELTMRLSSLRKKLLSLSEKLSQLRKSAAEKLSADMTSELSELNFANAQFAVNISPNVNSDGMPILSAEGTDVVEFLFNANKGGSLKPLSNVASGGEISRIALAFKRITNAAGSVPTLVFDEIDTGISGITASVVGRKLHEISEKHQVLCITHLPQIAACGDYQYLIARNDSDERSYTTITLLSEEERVCEIARLLGGTNITETTLASAGELLGFSH
jgi:DNA repair protein RecN (Recombination protein N)